MKKTVLLVFVFGMQILLRKIPEFLFLPVLVKNTLAAVVGVE
jgi:hypothetical protein